MGWSPAFRSPIHLHTYITTGTIWQYVRSYFSWLWSALHNSANTTQQTLTLKEKTNCRWMFNSPFSQTKCFFLLQLWSSQVVYPWYPQIQTQCLRPILPFGSPLDERQRLKMLCRWASFNTGGWVNAKSARYAFKEIRCSCSNICLDSSLGL